MLTVRFPRSFPNTVEVREELEAFWVVNKESIKEHSLRTILGVLYTRRVTPDNVSR